MAQDPGRPTQDPGRATLVLVLGILSIVFCGCGWILGPIAWMLGSADLKKIAAGEISEQARSNTQVGVYCGMIGTALGVLYLIGVCIYGGLMGFAVSSNAGKKVSLMIEPLFALLS
jgi:hypothetical protein